MSSFACRFSCCNSYTPRVRQSSRAGPCGSFYPRSHAKLGWPVRECFKAKAAIFEAKMKRAIQTSLHQQRILGPDSHRLIFEDLEELTDSEKEDIGVCLNMALGDYINTHDKARQLMGAVGVMGIYGGKIKTASALESPDATTRNSSAIGR